MTRIIQLKEYSDKELIAKHKLGQSGLSELYARYKHLVYGSCLKYFKNKTDADDAVSEIFVLLDKKLKIHEVESFKSWLYTVTRNYCIEVLRKKSRKRDKINNAELMYSESIFHPDEVEDEQMVKKLKLCIASLTEKQKMTIDLFYFKKESYKDIALQMNLSWNMVRSLMQNGRRNLKNCLESKNGEQ
ncbi:MAG: sigma-70 family RNA polymerase sigma factor [Saprospiraceae bacterium]|nr:sigma-70 family RNA polymerase sigma factor [Saprospiraceae bacterium]